jgi:Tannase-like family of unknown function (DUF6351)
MTRIIRRDASGTSGIRLCPSVGFPRACSAPRSTERQRAGGRRTAWDPSPRRPLALNPLFGTAPGVTPEQQAAVEWTHWADLVNIYGRDETGFARSPWDNRGVQYGLSALRAGSITPEQFLDLNASVGSWKEANDMVQEGCPRAPEADLPGRRLRLREGRRGATARAEREGGLRRGATDEAASAGA